MEILLNRQIIFFQLLMMNIKREENKILWKRGRVSIRHALAFEWYESEMSELKQIFQFNFHLIWLGEHFLIQILNIWIWSKISLFVIE